MKRHVSLEKILAARDHRQSIQAWMLRSLPNPLITFTLNIVGPIKVFPLSIKTFNAGVTLIKDTLAGHGYIITQEEIIQEQTGYEAFFSVSGSPLHLKSILCELEESTPLGRLFDIDVQRSDGSKVSRKIIGLPKRKCLLCHKNAFECSRSRAHSVKDLLRYEAKIMARWFNEAYADNVAMQCTRALLYEVTASPKPGLVDRFDSGANDDMDIFTFQDSALSLTPYFKAFVLCGIRYKSTPLRNVLNYLRPIGIAAERAMYNATKDVNTHKGLIFSAGLLCGALGHLYGNQQDINAQTLSYSISQISRPFKAWFERLAKSPDNTHGETLYLKFGIKGSRGEALEGFPILFNTALPYLKERIKEGFSLNDAGILTLCKIMEVADDTNVITRSSMGKLSIIKRRLKSAAPLEEEKYLSFIKKLNTYLIDLNINPGGSADILALTYFMYFMKI